MSSNYQYRTYSLKRRIFWWVVVENYTSYTVNGMGHQSLIQKNKNVFYSFFKSKAQVILDRYKDQNEAKMKRTRKT